MKRKRQISQSLGVKMLALVLCILASRGVGAPEAGVDVAQTSFSLLLERNIFDPDRHPPVAGEPMAPPPDETIPQAEPDYIDLLGTIILPDGAVAFFDGSRPDYGGRIRIGESIGPWRLMHLDTQAVQLHGTTDTQLSLPVGARLQLQSGDQWTIQERSEISQNFTVPASRSGPANTEKTEDRPQSGSAPAAAGSNDLLERMKQRRQQEMGR